MRHDKALQQARSTGLDHWIDNGKAEACSNEALFTNDILRIGDIPNPIKNVTHVSSYHI